MQTEGIPYRITVPKSHTKPKRLLARWQSVKTWYDHDWMKLDPKLRTSCVEGISSFLSLFDMEDVADIFWSPGTAGRKTRPSDPNGSREKKAESGSICHPWTT